MTSYKKEITKGVFWIAIAKYSGFAIQLIISAILARLISPSAFGTIAIAMVILHFLNILADIGIGPAVVQYKELTAEHLNSLFTLNLYIGIALSLLLFLFSSEISRYYADDVLCYVCQIFIIVVIFNSLNVVPNALMRRNKKFKIISLYTLSFQVLGGSVAVWGAFNGWGVYSLIISPIIAAIGVFCVNYYYYPLRFELHINNKAVKTISSFSLFQFAFSFINYFSRNLDKLIIGKHFSMGQLGYYDKSYHLMLLPVQNIAYIIDPVLHPILSSLKDDKKELSNKNIKLVRVISYISFPLGLILYFCGGELIKIVYGSKWDAAIPVFQILALSLPLQIILPTSGTIYQAAGKTNFMFYNGVINTSVTIIGFFIAAINFKNINAMAWAWVITLLINFFISYYILYKFALVEKVNLLFRALIPQFINSVTTFLIVTILFRYLEGYNLFFSLFVKSSFIILITLVMGISIRQYSIKQICKFKLRK